MNKASPRAATLELMHKRVDPVKIHSGLLPAHAQEHEITRIRVNTGSPMAMIRPQT
jgi:hypothetical protein